MASVWKHNPPKDTYWIAKYKDESGKWRNKSTKIHSKETLRKRALEVAQKWEDDAQKIDVIALTEQQIIKGAREIAERAYPDKVKRESVDTYFRRWLTREKDKVSKTTFETYSSQVEQFLSGIGSEAAKPLTALMSVTIERYRDVLEKQGKASATVINHCKTIKTALQDAYRKNVISFNPAEALEHAPKQSSEKKPFTQGEVSKILAVAEGEWKTAILFGIYTGARLGDCVRMEWKDVNFFDKPHLTYTPDKQKRGTEKPLTISLHRVLVSHLHDLVKASQKTPAGFITSNLSQRSPGGTTGLSRQFTEIMKRAGVDQSQLKIRKGGRAFSEKSFHSFRHTLTTLLAKSGAKEEVRRAITGHKSKEVHQIYTHMDLDDQQKAFEAIPDFLAK